jgi:phytanoyl-CoA hydroxylase
MTAALRAAFARDGWVRLPTTLPPAALVALRARADDLMLGRHVVPGMFFQHDSPDGSYGALVYGRGYVGPSRSYRKLEKLERDDAFRPWLDPPALEPIVRALVADEALAPSAQIRLARAVLWTKAARGGTELPWHQDAGPFWGIAPAPRLTIWTALDDAPAAAGALELAPGSHLGGLATPGGGVIPEDVIARSAPTTIVVPVRAGEQLALHNLLWHRSGRNATAAPRRALSVCYLAPASACTRRRRPRQFLPLFTTDAPARLDGPTPGLR